MSDLWHGHLLGSTQAPLPPASIPPQPTLPKMVNKRLAMCLISSSFTCSLSTCSLSGVWHLVWVCPTDRAHEVSYAPSPPPPWPSSGAGFLNWDKFHAALRAAGEAPDGWESVKIKKKTKKKTGAVTAALLLFTHSHCCQTLNAYQTGYMPLRTLPVHNCAKQWQSSSNTPSQACFVVWGGHPATLMNH